MKLTFRTTLLLALLLTLPSPAAAQWLPPPKRELWAIPLWEMDAFPSRETAWEQRGRFDLHIGWLKKQIETRPWRYSLTPLTDTQAEQLYQTRLTEAQFCRTAWDKLADARTTYWDTLTRLRNADELRGLLGDEAFYRGDMPGWLPEVSYPPTPPEGPRWP
jgi:hypothetical protein